MTTETTRTTRILTRPAAAVDAYPEGRDATVLAAAVARATGGDLLLLTVEPDLPLLIPGINRHHVRRETVAMLRGVRDSLAPGARCRVSSDLSIPRGLERLARMYHRDLLVVGSSRRGVPGEVRIGGRTRQLIAELDCPLAIAPRGLSRAPHLELRHIGVGYDGGAEARAGLDAAARIAAGAGAQLTVRGVIDDRIPALGWPNVWMGAIMRSWSEIMDEQADELRRDIEHALSGQDVAAAVQIERGRPCTSLQALSEECDLLVIGSRRWGPLARLVLGSTGERLVHGGTRSSLLLVPRPHAPAAAATGVRPEPDPREIADAAR